MVRSHRVARSHGALQMMVRTVVSMLSKMGAMEGYKQRRDMIRLKF